MCDTVKLIVEIPKEIYKASQIIDVKYDDVIQIPLEVIKNGTPLDDVKVEIKEKSFGIFDSPNLIKTIDVFEIIDNKGKAESEE